MDHAKQSFVAAMGVDKRRSPRKPFERSAFIKHDGSGRSEPCILRNVSHTGARVACTAPQAIPDRFVLAFSAEGTVSRECFVVWRSGLELGVEFSGASTGSAEGRRGSERLGRIHARSLKE